MMKMLAVVPPFPPLSSGMVSFQDLQFQKEVLSSWYLYGHVAGREALTAGKSLVFHRSSQPPGRRNLTWIWKGRC